MWESLATSRRQDRVLHGAAKWTGLVASFFLYPAWLIGERLAGPLRAFLDRRAHADLPVPPAPTSAHSADTVRELQELPHRLRFARTTTLRKGWSDASTFLLNQKRQTINFAYAYPRQFTYEYVEAADGERVAAQIATHETPRPGLIVVHGLLSSRHFDYVREIAVRAYYEWGFNVAAIDLRSFGLTEISPARRARPGGRRARTSCMSRGA